METYTYHVMRRSKERLNQSKKYACRQIHLAYERGDRADDINSNREKTYMENLTNDQGYPVVYNNCCYIFSNANDAAITVFEMPGWWNKKHYDGKTRIRNCRKYAKKYAENY